MRLLCRKKGFSIVEILTVIAVITVLAAMVLGVGKHVKEMGNIKLTKSTIDILVTAVEQYYQDEGRMPSNSFGGTPVIKTGSVESSWSGEALYYRLSQSYNSKRLINTIDDSLITSRDAAGDVLTVDVTYTDPGTGTVTFIETDLVLPRFVDAWGNTLRYNYSSGDTFCVISSPGKDKKYGTEDDINNLN
ncbi:MAG: type II secretion system GspH family protein [Phycisphaerae bacterium]|nr:type II secretion system GspH family protein [Phycisphaerae bacterium]